MTPKITYAATGDVVEPLCSDTPTVACGDCTNASGRVGCGAGGPVGGTVADGTVEGITVAGTAATAVAETVGGVAGEAVGETVGAAGCDMVVGELVRVDAGDALTGAGAAEQIWSSDITGGVTLFPHAQPSTAPSET